MPKRPTVDTVVIGAGHAGLAVSYYLGKHDIEHFVLERGEIANSWRHERWDSLRLLTPNWQSRLPGFAYSGDEPDSFMTMQEVIDFIKNYARHAEAPVHTETKVTSLSLESDLYRIRSTQGDYCARSVVIASGACNLPVIPAAAESLPDGVQSISAHQYRSPQSLQQGGVLVVGASATGLQLADEIHRSGRPVTLAVGEHVRMPRSYRSRDIQWWLDAAGILDEGLDVIDDIVRARALPSPQLVGSRARQILDLNAMSASGIKLVGKLTSVNGTVAQFSGSLRNVCTLADLKMGRLLDTIDEWAAIQPEELQAGPQERFERTRVDESPCLQLDLRDSEIRTVAWATGFRPDYSWLEVPVLDRKGRIRHDGGVVNSPGLYVIGLPFLRRRKSSFIHGTKDDARHISQHLANYLGA